MRGKQATKRKIAPDIRFNRDDVAKFINFIMQRGKKTVARDIVYGALEIVAEKSGGDPVEMFDKAIKNVSPTVEIKGRRVGGANYQVPMSVRPERSFALGCRWLIAAAKARKGRPMAEKLAEELLAAANNEGSAIKKKQDTYKMAEANRAFAHFAR